MKVIIFGIGDFAKQLYSYLSVDSELSVEYFCVNNDFIEKNEYLGKEVIPFENISDYLNPVEFKFIIGIGYKKMRLRKKVFKEIKDNGYNLINYIHPTATILGNVIGEGNIILPNVTVEPFSLIGDNNVIWTNTTVCHDARVEKHNFIAASCVIGGFTKIKDNNFLGFNSVVKDNIIVDKEVLVGAKSLILRNPDDYSSYYGNPAKKIAEHKEFGIEII